MSQNTGSFIDATGAAKARAAEPLPKPSSEGCGSHAADLWIHRENFHKETILPPLWQSFVNI